MISPTPSDAHLTAATTDDKVLMGISWCATHTALGHASTRHPGHRVYRLRSTPAEALEYLRHDDASDPRTAMDHFDIVPVFQRCDMAGVVVALRGV